jgi:hypothetical protein
MPSLRTLIVAAAAAALAAPAAAVAAPPPNDNYLSSTTIDPAAAAFPKAFRETADTTEATTQADTFNPNKDGVPFGGGAPEPTTCAQGAPPFGRTAWWDFRAPHPGGVQIKADAGFDVVVAVYQWSAQTSRITRTVTCQNDSPGSEDVLLPDVRKGTNYTVQVGGRADAGGPLDFQLSYFPDRDDDGRFDADDDCVNRPGTSSGCPPELRATPRIRYDNVAGGIRVTSLAVDDVPKGARAEVTGVGKRLRKKARRSGVLSLDGVAGRAVKAGRKIQIRITLGRTGKGRFRFGATGKYYRWPVTADGLGDRVSRCLNPGSRKPVKCR